MVACDPPPSCLFIMSILATGLRMKSASRDLGQDGRSGGHGPLRDGRSSWSAWLTRSGAWPSPADMPHPGHVHRRGMTSVAGTAVYVPDAPASFTVGLVARVEDEES